ncbi:MAG TPA: class II aldolase/adducin family protein [Candidatus Choladousia intestinavium]|uniref:Class II aldolase/adducin family protein n=1 Tax=Candidatus Choladousia intestinavium TaxID=2840727 RepID=A0A9D1D8N2_9FIRM|nr:class II aldolase/adducin family protein [Candidatus Choladousia intestinavium]
MDNMKEKMLELGISEEAIHEVLFVAKRMDEKGLVNSFAGNISTKKDGKIYITPTGQNKGILTPEKIAVVDENGKRIWGMKETSEIIMHTMAYDICEENGWDVAGVVHSHSKILTAFSMAGLDIETEAFPEMMGNFHRIPCVPYGAPGTKYILTMAEPYLAEGYRIVLLGNHGSLAVGKTVEDAMNVVEACEALAEQILITKYIIGKEKSLGRDEVDRFFEIYKENREKRRIKGD